MLYSCTHTGMATVDVKGLTAAVHAYRAACPTTKFIIIIIAINDIFNAA